MSTTTTKTTTKTARQSSPPPQAAGAPDPTPGPSGGVPDINIRDFDLRDSRPASRVDSVDRRRRVSAPPDSRRTPFHTIAEDHVRRHHPDDDDDDEDYNVQVKRDTRLAKRTGHAVTPHSPRIR